ncbi:hypothetical protein EVAR_91804_1, partial [Eumeta japonica]
MATPPKLKFASQPSSVKLGLIKSERKKTLSIIDHAATHCKKPPTIERSVRIVKRGNPGVYTLDEEEIPAVTTCSRRCLQLIMMLDIGTFEKLYVLKVKEKIYRENLPPHIRSTNIDNDPLAVHTAPKQRACR